MKQFRTTEFQHLLLLIVAAIIWGLTFVSQKMGMETMGPFGFSAVRFYIGALAITPLFLLQKWIILPPSQQLSMAKTIIGGVLLGGLLFLASGLQQVGMVQTNAGNAGFVTSLYIILVPFLGLFIGHHITQKSWIGALLAIGGLYLLSGNGELHLAPGDGLVLISALFWALHILVTSYYATKTNIIFLAVVQFTTTATLHLGMTLLFEELSLQAIYATIGPILFAGVLSSGVAFTLQIISQRHVAPAKAAIVMSLEALFGLLGGILFLHETITLLQGVGAVIMLGGLIFSQLDEAKEHQTTTTS